MSASDVPAPASMRSATALDAPVPDDAATDLDIAEIRIDRDDNGVGRITEGAAVTLRLVAAG